VTRKLEYYLIIIFLKGLDILHQERRGQVNAMVLEHFKNIPFHKFVPASKSISIYQF